MSSLKTSFVRPGFAPLSLARTVWKHKFLAIAIWCTLAGAAFVAVRLIPAIYYADALILVDSQKIPERFVTSSVNIDLQDRLTPITQQVLSDSRLEKLLDELSLYPEERKKKYKEELLALMRRDIIVRIEKNYRDARAGAFHVGFTSRNRFHAAEVANRIANFFVDENLKQREMQAAGTSEFLDSQLQEAKRRLDEQEAAMSQYKVRFNGELPQQEAALVGTLGRLQVQLEANRDALNRAEQSVSAMENTLGTMQAAAQMRAQARAQMQRQSQIAAAQTTLNSDDRPAREVAIPAEKASATMRRQLSALRLKYSDEHPEVRRLEQALQRTIEEEAAGEAAAPPKTPGATTASRRVAPAPPPEPVALPDPDTIQANERMAALRSQMQLARDEIKRRREDQDRINGQIDIYQARVERLPLREQDMSRVTRDYENSKNNYKSLLDKKLAADMATDMERRQKSERFTLAEPARVPFVPAKPNRILLFGVGILLATGIALATIFGLELRRDMILGSWELPPGVMVLGTLPRIAIAANVPEDNGGGQARGTLIASPQVR